MIAQAFGEAMTVLNAQVATARKPPRSDIADLVKKLYKEMQAYQDIVEHCVTLLFAENLLAVQSCIHGTDPRPG